MSLKLKGSAAFVHGEKKHLTFAIKSEPRKAIERLISELPARRIFLSYSTEGHVPIKSLSDSLAGIGELSVHSLQNIGRYRPNKAASKAASDVGELLFCIEKTKEAKRVAA